MTSLISVSGRIGSGKDTVGKIIQAYMEFPNASNEAILRMVHSGIDNPTSKIKKWADKLKDIVCLLLNCTREELEDHDFKSKELGEEWWYFAETVTHNKIPYLENREVLLDKFPVWKITPRLLLQLLGTDCGRNIIHPNIWVNSLMSGYKMSYVQHKDIEDVEHKQYPNWIITDTRFPNELEAVKSRGGITIIVRRNIHTTLANGTPIQIEQDYSLTPQHESETALDDATFDYAIDNYGTMEELIEQVRQILIIEKII